VQTKAWLNLWLRPEDQQNGDPAPGRPGATDVTATLDRPSGVMIQVIDRGRLARSRLGIDGATTKIIKFIPEYEDRPIKVFVPRTGRTK